MMANATEIRIATAGDLKFLIDLQRRFSRELGFLPKPALRDYIAQSLVAIAVENDEPAGFFLHRPSLQWQPQCSRITQAAVSFDAQRQHHATALLLSLEHRLRAQGSKVLTLRCLPSIEANAFWLTAGFEKKAVVFGSNNRGEPLNVYAKQLTNEWAGNINYFLGKSHATALRRTPEELGELRLAARLRRAVSPS